MESKLKVALHAVVSIGANLLLLGIVPSEYKLWAVLVFNVAQVAYAYYDPTYAFQKLGEVKKEV